MLLQDAKKDWALNLILAYYSMSLIPAFMLEGYYSQLLLNVVGKEGSDKPF